MKRIYISGPMSGIPGHNFPTFHIEAARLRTLGYDVVNPAELNSEPGSKPYNDCLRTDLVELLACDTIAMLPGWQRSNGAHLEMHVAHRVGIEIVEAKDIQAPPATPVMQGDDAPAPSWDDCKVAYGIDDEDALWGAWKIGTLELPAGWTLNETDGTGARMVAVFRVNGIPTEADSRSALAALAAAGARRAS